MPVRVRHWTMLNGSGMRRVAESISTAEQALGLDSRLVDCTVQSEAWTEAMDADIHVVHTHIPDTVQHHTTGKIVWVAHGTPDHCFQSSVEAGTMGGYGHSDSWMMMQHWLRVADARVTFWPRHQWIYQSMVPKGTKVHCVPLGVDTAFWAGGVSRGKWDGHPSVLTCENPHYIKWPYDLFIAWPEVYRTVDGAKLHAIYLVRDMHRWFFTLANQNGTSYGAHLSALTFDHAELRNVLKSVDFYLGLVRYGDFNHMALQANAAGCKTISYAGNPYSDFWIPEGDQRTIASTLTAILLGEVEPRQKLPVPDITATAAAMHAIYEDLLNDELSQRPHARRVDEGAPDHQGVHRPEREDRPADDHLALREDLERREAWQRRVDRRGRGDRPGLGDRGRDADRSQLVPAAE